MIQIYSPSNTNYDKNGDVVLQPSSMILHAVLNGEWTAELTHPVDEEGRWQHIVENAVVKCPSFLPDDQLYRIKSVSKNDSEVTADLEPVFLDAIGDCWITDIRPTGKTGQQALNDMLSPNSKYSGSSDILTIATAYWQNMNAVEALNGDIDQSFINRWGGEILYNNYELIVNQRAGADHGVSVRYGKNLSVDGMEYTVDMSDVTTRIYPQGYNGREMTNHGHVDSEHINDYPTVFSKSIKFDNVRLAEDVSDTDDTEGMIVCQTQEELDTALTQKCKAEFEAGADVPRVTIKVDMVLLQNTENYADVSELESVSLGDDVQCINANMGINTKSRVVELEYDACGKCVTSVTVGELEPSYFKNVTSSTQRIDAVTTPAGDLIAERVQGTLNAIKTQLRLQSTVAEKVDGVAFLIEDLDPNSKMYGAMEAGSQGLRIANERTADGRAWDWRTAITADGIVADLIASGTLRAIDIDGVNITGSTIIFGTTGKVVTASSTEDGNGVVFNGEGEIRFQTKNTAFYRNYEQDGTIANSFVITAHDGRGAGTNQLELYNYWDGKYANSMELQANDTWTEVYMLNEDYSHLRPFNAVWTGYENLIRMVSNSERKFVTIKNAMFNAPAIASTIEAWATAGSEAVGLFNYCGKESSVNQITARREDSNYYIGLYNSYNGDRQSNHLILRALGNTRNELLIRNLDLQNGGNVASLLDMYSSADGNVIDLSNYQGRNRVARIYFFKSGSLTLESTKIFDVNNRTRSVINSNSNVDGGAVQLYNGRYMGSAVISSNFGAGRHAITLGWDGSRLILYVDTTFIGYVNTSR